MIGLCEVSGIFVGYVLEYFPKAKRTLRCRGAQV